MDNIVCMYVCLQHIYIYVYTYIISIACACAIFKFKLSISLDLCTQEHAFLWHAMWCCSNSLGLAQNDWAVKCMVERLNMPNIADNRASKQHKMYHYNIFFMYIYIYLYTHEVVSKSLFRDSERRPLWFLHFICIVHWAVYVCIFVCILGTGLLAVWVAHSLI